MRRTIQFILSVLLGGFLFGVGECSAQEVHRSPFSAVRWMDSPTPQVQVREQWYQLETAEGIPVDTLTALAIEGAGRDWQRAYVEWFDWLVQQTGRTLGPTARLQLTPLPEGDPIVLDSVAVTAQKQQAAWRQYHVAARRVTREHSSSVSDNFRHLTRRIDGQAPPQGFSADSTLSISTLYPCIHGDLGAEGCHVPEWLSPGSARRDLSHLEWLLEHRFSYLTLRDVDYRSAIDAIWNDLGAGISRRDFALQIRRLIALFGDGHSRMSLGATRLDLPEGTAPFRMVEIADQVAAVEWDRSGFVAPDFPFIQHVDGVPVDRWRTLAQETAPDGSPQLHRYQTLVEMHRLGYLRALLDLPQRDILKVTLSNEAGTETRTVQRAVRSRFPNQDPPTLEGRVLPGTADVDSIGYLAIREMDRGDDFLGQIHQHMRRFQNTDGLILDVRRNGGGTRDVLRSLLPYFLSPSDSLRVVNVAALRTNSAATPHHPEGFLTPRYAYPISSRRWSASERRQLSAFAASFDPEWNLPNEQFSRWHYMAIRSDTTGRRYSYDRPVVLLMNQTNYSATDIFLGAFKGLPNATLIGTPSRGGSGYTETYYLPHSRVGVKLSSMASFRPNGMLYEGRGIEPDVAFRMSLEHWQNYFHGKRPMIEEAINQIARD